MSDQSMTAVVEYQIRAENTSMSDWLSEWAKRAHDAQLGEPETAAYEAAVSLDDPNNVLVFERYDRGASSLKAHVDRPAHAQLVETMGARNMTKRRVTSCRFVDIPDLGWWSRSSAPRSNPLLVLLGLRFADDDMRDAFVDLSKSHAGYCFEAEPETLIYSGGVAAADADRGPDIKTGDLIFAMACTDMAAVEKHRDDPNHIALGERIAAAGIEMTATFNQMYQTTGRGFLWR